MGPLCRIQLLGGLRVDHSNGREIRRFQTAKTGLLLAYLALHLDRPHPRETLCDLLWPEDDPASSRHKLRMALSSLRRQLEPPGVRSGAVIRADRLYISLDPYFVETDVHAFESALRDAGRSAGSDDQTANLELANGLYAGDLLPGFYEDWVLAQRDRLAEMHLTVLRKLTRLNVEAGALERAEVYARRAVETDPLREELHRDLMRVLAALGQPSAALKEYRRLEGTLRDQLDAAPSPESQVLAARLCCRASKDFQAAPHTPGPITAHRKEDSVLAGVDEVRLRSPRLPVYLDRFFGRETEIEIMTRLLRPESADRARLVTLIGPGGSGKTRLAVEVARQLESMLPEAVWFCGLADVTDADRIPEALRDSLRVAADPNTDALAQVCGFLQDQRACIVLDNLEHLAPAAALSVRALLNAVPGLSVLATSRCALELSGERLLPVSPLPLPDPGISPGEMADCASVRMFVDRAQAVRPDFQITPRTAGDLASLCIRLEGIPLAIELAAARARMLTLKQMREGLEDRSDIFVSRKRDVPERQRSLKAAMDWSFRLLNTKVQKFFAELSVFSGGFTLYAAEVVCGAERAAEYIEILMGASLLTSSDSLCERRYCMLETIRQYAAERLPADKGSEVAFRHARYFIDLLEEMEPQMEGELQAELLDRLEREHDNLRAALRWLRANDAGAALRLCGLLGFFWGARHVREGYQLVTEILTLPEGSDAARARALWTAARLAFFQADNEAESTLNEEYLGISRRLGDRRGMAEALRGLSRAASRQGDCDRAESLCAESNRLFREVGDARGVAGTLNNLGLIAYHRRDLATAGTYYDECLSLMRDLGGPEIATVLSNLGDVACEREDYAAAGRHYEEALKLRRESGYQNAVAYALGRLARLARLQKDFVLARQRHAESLAICRNCNARGYLAWEMEEIAALEAEEGRHRLGAVYLGAAESARKSSGISLHSIEQAAHEQTIAVVQETLGQNVFQVEWTRGAAMTLDECLDFATRTPRS